MNQQCEDREQLTLKILHSKKFRLERNWYEKYNVIAYFNVKNCYTFLNFCSIFLILCSKPVKLFPV